MVPSDWAISRPFPGYFCQGEVAGGFMVGHHIFQLSISCRVHVTLEISVRYDFFSQCFCEVSIIIS